MTPWTDFGSGIRVRQSRAYAMNSTLLLDRDHAVLVDPGVLPSELDELAAVVRETEPRALTLVFSHAHWDHVLGRRWWPEAATVGHALLAAEVERERESIDREAVACAVEAGESWDGKFEPFAPAEAVHGERSLTRGPWTLVLRDAPGHCDSQITIHLPAHRLLVAGDMLSDIEIPWLDREPAAYQRTLRGLLSLAERGEIQTLISGHGAIARGAEAVLARLHRDLGYLDELDAGVRAARARGLTREEAQARLAEMDYTGKSAEYPMDDVHRENVRIAWERATPTADE
jgi:glyoxylase-like metal-dependent hydrolase (beta-lactamase superfamily II)